MRTLDSTSSLPSDAPADQPTGRGPIVVATDGFEPSDAAFHVAAAVAEQSGARVEVVSVFEPVVSSDLQFVAMPVLPPDWYATQQAVSMDATRAQLSRTRGARSEWPIIQLDGEPSASILEQVTRCDGRLIVVGRGRHGLLDRLLGGETVLRLLRGGTAPLLAVEPSQRTLFHRAVITTDFSPQSVHAARIAMSVLAPDAKITLVHVKPRLVVRGPQFDYWRKMYEQTLPAAFENVRQALNAPATMTFETLTLEGEAGRAIVEFTKAVQADLVVSATHGYGFVHRLVVGSVATELLRHAPCSLLCVPGTALDGASARAQLAVRFRTETLAPDDWAEAMALLSSDEGSRSASLEVEYPSFGAQTIVSHVPFVGAAYEAAGGHVQLMFGAGRATGYHLTHMIDGVTGIDLLRDEADRPRVVRFAHPNGQTLLSLER